MASPDIDETGRAPHTGDAVRDQARDVEAQVSRLDGASPPGASHSPMAIGRGGDLAGGQPVPVDGTAAVDTDPTETREWIVSARSRAVAAISIASAPSAMSSPAPAPTIPTPSTVSVSGSTSIFVRPSVRPSAWARPLAAQG